MNTQKKKTPRKTQSLCQKDWPETENTGRIFKKSLRTWKKTGRRDFSSPSDNFFSLSYFSILLVFKFPPLVLSLCLTVTVQAVFSTFFWRLYWFQWGETLWADFYDDNCCYDASILPFSTFFFFSQHTEKEKEIEKLRKKARRIYWDRLLTFSTDEIDWLL